MALRGHLKAFRGIVWLLDDLGIIVPLRGFVSLIAPLSTLSDSSGVEVLNALECPVEGLCWVWRIGGQRQRSCASWCQRRQLGCRRGGRLVGTGFFKVVLVSLNQLLKLLFGNLFLF